MATNGKSTPRIVPASPSPKDTAGAAVDVWAAAAWEAGNYSAAEHAELVDAVLSCRRIPVIGEIRDGKITFYAPPQAQ